MEPAWWVERFDPIHPGGSSAPMVLRDPSGRQEFGVPGLQEKSLKRVNGLDIATTTGSVDALLELEDRPFDFAPRDVLPCIHRSSCRVHAVCTPPGPSTFHITGRPSAYPQAFPETLASDAIPPQCQACG